MEINLKLTISFLLPAAFMLLLVACGDSQPLPDIDATVEARLKERLAAIPTPTARVVEKEVVKEVVVEKEVIVEKIVVVTATPTPMPTATPTPTSAPTPMQKATPLEAFEGTIHITSQTGVMVHGVKWSLINNSRQDVTLVKAEIHNDSGLMLGAVIFGEKRLAAGRDSNVNTTFMNATEEQVMTYQFVWTFRMHTGETIVCTFSITNPKSCRVV